MKHVQRLRNKVFRRSASPARLEPQNPSMSATTTESMEPRTENYGLFNLAPITPVPSGSKNYSVDIIAVHGLNGDAYSTWRHHPDGTLWLRDLLPKFLPGCRVYTYGYPSKIFSESTARVQDYARHLLISVRDMREDPPTVRPLGLYTVVVPDTAARVIVLSFLYVIVLVGLFLNRFVSHCP